MGNGCGVHHIVPIVESYRGDKACSEIFAEADLDNDMMLTFDEVCIESIFSLLHRPSLLLFLKERMKEGKKERRKEGKK